jgi:hypothetical protein
MICISVAQLIDTNVLVYRVDARFPAKQERAATIIEETVRSGEWVNRLMAPWAVPHQNPDNNRKIRRQIF